MLRRAHIFICKLKDWKTWYHHNNKNLKELAYVFLCGWSLLQYQNGVFWCYILREIVWIFLIKALSYDEREIITLTDSGSDCGFINNIFTEFAKYIRAILPVLFFSFFPISTYISISGIFAVFFKPPWFPSIFL